MSKKGCTVILQSLDERRQLIRQKNPEIDIQSYAKKITEPLRLNNVTDSLINENDKKIGFDHINLVNLRSPTSNNDFNQHNEYRENETRIIEEKHDNFIGLSEEVGKDFKNIDSENILISHHSASINLIDPKQSKPPKPFAKTLPAPVKRIGQVSGVSGGIKAITNLYDVLAEQKRGNPSNMGIQSTNEV